MQCLLDLVSVYNQVKALTVTNGIHAAAFGGETITKGMYSVASALSIASVLTLDTQGDPDAVFVFKANGAINAGAGTTISLINGTTSK